MEQRVKERVEHNVLQEDSIDDTMQQEDKIISHLLEVYSSIGINKHVDDRNIKEIPIIVESEAPDDEMDDYYENHKAWPSRSS